MPLRVDWREEDRFVEIDFVWRGGGRQLADDVLAVDWFVRVNVLGEGVEMVDLHGQVDAETMEMVRNEGGRLTLRLLKRTDLSLWGRLRADPRTVARDEILRRREAGMRQQEEREQRQRVQQQEEKRRKEKAGEAYSWKQDNDQKQAIDDWKEHITHEAIKDVQFTIPDTALHERADTQTNAPPMRVAGPANLGTNKIGLNFTARAAPGVPARDSRQRREVAQCSAPARSENSDWVWLKEQGDTFVQSGDYKAGYLAYTEAIEKRGEQPSNDLLKLLSNRAVASIYLCRVSVALEDINIALRILHKRDTSLFSDEEEFMNTTLLMRAAQCELMLGNLRGAWRSSQQAVHQVGKCAWLGAAEKQAVMRDAAELEKSVEFIGSGSKKKADSYFAAGVYDKAVDLYMQHDNPVIVSNRGLTYMMMGDIQQGQAVSEKAKQRVDEDWCIEYTKPVSIGKLLSKRKVLRSPPSALYPTSVDEQNNWLMRQEGVDQSADLPSIPNEWEWVRDGHTQNSWIAKKKPVCANVQLKIERLRHLCESAKANVTSNIIQEIAELRRECGEGVLVEMLDAVDKYVADVRVLEDEYSAILNAQLTRRSGGKSEFVPNHMALLTRRKLLDKINARLDKMRLAVE